MSNRTDGIRFGNWKLVPRDKLNWELYHLRASERGFGDGTERWASEGRFYQYNTFANALRYAADVELKNGCHGRVMEIEDAIHEYKTIMAALVADMERALEGGRK